MRIGRSREAQWEMPLPTNSSSPGTFNVVKREPAATMRARARRGARRLPAALHRYLAPLAPHRPHLAHAQLGAGRVGLLLEGRAQRVAGDAVGEGGGIVDVLAAEQLGRRGEA